MDKYKEAIERLKQWDREHPDGAYSIQERDEFIFPELAESENEKSRKWLVGLLRKMQFHHCDDEMEMGNKALAWLEKQGEQKPWSEEDEKMRNFVINIFKDSQRHGVSETIMPEQFNKIFDWLESLRPQSQWKPSENNLNSLSKVIEHYECEGLWIGDVKELLEQLKKL